jgi:hypothetical protein
VALGALALLYVPVLAYVAIVATPSYGLAPKVAMFIPPIALASLAFSLLASTRTVRPLAWLVMILAALVLGENIVAIVGHEIGWASRQGAGGAGAVLEGFDASATRLPYWLALALPAAHAAACLKMLRPCPPSTSSRK